ncbi:hypothetical protein RIF29_40251 [Crotalaria pallida]|uniref:Uncharacterized protein n=1 Tax=Crotalaria pallida TaxID=3830 RepID=A0AAN9E946_CROPI
MRAKNMQVNFQNTGPPFLASSSWFEQHNNVTTKWERHQATSKAIFASLSAIALCSLTNQDQTKSVGIGLLLSSIEAPTKSVGISALLLSSIEAPTKSVGISALLSSIGHDDTTTNKSSYLTCRCLRIPANEVFDTYKMFQQVLVFNHNQRQAFCTFACPKFITDQIISKSSPYCRLLFLLCNLASLSSVYLDTFRFTFETLSPQRYSLPRSSSMEANAEYPMFVDEQYAVVDPWIDVLDLCLVENGDLVVFAGRGITKFKTTTAYCSSTNIRYSAFVLLPLKKIGEVNSVVVKGFQMNANIIVKTSLELSNDDAFYTFKYHTGPLYAVACSPTDPTLVATGGSFLFSCLWKIRGDNEERDWFKMLNEGHIDFATSTLAFSYDGHYIDWLRWHPTEHKLLASYADSSVIMWNADTLECIKCFAGHGPITTCGDFTPNDEILRIWKPETGENIHVVQGSGYHTKDLLCLAITSTSALALAGSKDGSAHTVDIIEEVNLLVIDTLASHSDESYSIMSVGFAPSNCLAAIAGMDQRLKIWDIEHSSPRSTCVHEFGVTSLAWIGSSYVATYCEIMGYPVWEMCTSMRRSQGCHSFSFCHCKWELPCFGFI